jgi:hypothetical protein
MTSRFHERGQIPGFARDQIEELLGFLVGEVRIAGTQLLGQTQHPREGRA